MKIIIPLKQILKESKDKSKTAKEMITKAYLLSKKVHKGQKFDGTKYDYFLHPAYSGFLMAKWGRNWESICAALLHDVVEDCGINLIRILREFGQKTAFYVDGMSWRLEWSEKEQRYLKDWEGFFKRICGYTTQDSNIILLHCADERSKLKDITGKQFEKTDEPKKKTIIRFTRYLSFYVPLYKAMGLKAHSEKLYAQLHSTTRKDAKLKLHQYI